MDIRELPLDELVLDPNLNLRDRLDDFTVERYAEAWERLPPVTVFEVDGRWLLADGFHRHAAAVMLGKQVDPGRGPSRGRSTEALDFVASVNLFHGLPLTRAERRRAVDDQAAAAPRLVGPPDGRGAGRQPRAGGQDPADADRGRARSRTTPAGSGPTARSTRRPDSPKDPNERLPKGQADRPAGRPPRPRRPRERRRPLGRRHHADARRRPSSRRPRPPPGSPPTPRPSPSSDPVPAAAPTIDEMLALMAKQIMEVDHLDPGRGLRRRLPHRQRQRPGPLPGRRHQARRPGRPVAQVLSSGDPDFGDGGDAPFRARLGRSFPNRSPFGVAADGPRVQCTIRSTTPNASSPRLTMTLT